MSNPNPISRVFNILNRFDRMGTITGTVLYGSFLMVLVAVGLCIAAFIEPRGGRFLLFFALILGGIGIGLPAMMFLGRIIFRLQIDIRDHSWNPVAKWVRPFMRYVVGISLLFVVAGAVILFVPAVREGISPERIIVAKVMFPIYVGILVITMIWYVLHKSFRFRLSRPLLED